MNRLPNRFRSYLHWLFTVIMLLMTLASAIDVRANTDALKFLSPDEIDIVLEQDGGMGEYTAKETVTVQSTGKAAVKVKFCVVLQTTKEETTCSEEAAAGVTLDYYPPEGVKIEKGGVKQFELIFTTHKPPEETLKGHLIVKAADNDDVEAGVLPLTLNPPDPTPILKFLFKPKSGVADADKRLLARLTTGDVIGGALIVAFLLILTVVVWIMYDNQLGPRACWNLRMGIAEWKLEESWASTLVVGVAILENISDLLPEDASRLTDTGFKGLTTLFAVMTALAAFVYNATTRPGFEDDEKEGYVRWFLIASLISVWALLGQLGIQSILLEEIWADSDSVIPSGVINLLQFCLLALLLFSCGYVVSKLVNSVQGQDVKRQKAEIKPGHVRRKVLKQIKRRVWKTRFLLLLKRKPSGDDIQETVKGIASAFSKMDDLALKLQKAGVKEPEKDDMVKYLPKLFAGLPEHFEKAPNKKEAGARLQEIIWDTCEALDLLNRGKSPLEVVTAFFTSLGIPHEVRQDRYCKAIEKIKVHVDTAYAQLFSWIELDKVLVGADQALFPGITETLDWLDNQLGNPQPKDKLYEELERILLEEGKPVLMKLRRADLSKKLDDISGSLTKASGTLKSNGSIKEALEPLASTLGVGPPGEEVDVQLEKMSVRQDQLYMSLPWAERRGRTSRIIRAAAQEPPVKLQRVSLL